MENYIPLVKNLLTNFDDDIKIYFNQAHQLVFTLPSLTITWHDISSYFVKYANKTVYVQIQKQQTIINTGHYDLIFKDDKSISILNNFTNQYNIIQQNINIEGHIQYQDGIFKLFDEHNQIVEYNFNTMTFNVLDIFSVHKNGDVLIKYYIADILLSIYHINKIKENISYKLLFNILIQHENITYNVRYYFNSESEKVSYIKQKFMSKNAQTGQLLFVKKYTDKTLTIKYNHLRVNFSSIDVYLTSTHNADLKYCRYLSQVAENDNSEYYKVKEQSQLYDNSYVNLYPVLFTNLLDLVTYYMLDYNLLANNIQQLY